MKRAAAVVALCAAVAVAAGVRHARRPRSVVVVPAGFAEPLLPPGEVPTADRVELGRRLFYDRRLSRTGKTSCATCHQQARAFTDGRARAVGDTGEVHPRGAMSLANVVYAPRLNWSNPLVTTLEAQARTPMFGEDPVEMGMGGREADLERLLGDEPAYRELLPRAFPGERGPFGVEHALRAIAAFERTLLSGDSAYDRFARGDRAALSPKARAGMELFFSERLECFHCHGGFTFADAATHVKAREAPAPYHNTGLYNLGPRGEYPAESRGVYDVTRDPRDMGRFKAPSLRNVAVTAPYMHDGSLATLEEVIDHYAAGGRTIAAGPNAGVGADNPNKSEFVAGFQLSEVERRALVAFLESLTDEAFLRDARFSDPWAGQPSR